MTTTASPTTPHLAAHQIQFGVFFQGVNFSTIWHWPESGDQVAFESFRRVAQTAERGNFAALFVGEGLRLREHLGRLHDLDIAGRPDAQTLDAALAAVTERIGLVATQSTTFNDPADLAYRLASLNRLSGGRNAWNIVTTHNAWTGENFRRGGYLDGADRYRHAESFVRAVKAIWRAGGDPEAVPVRYRDEFYDIAVERTLPLVAGGRPVLFQAGDSPEGRDFAARQADLIFSAHPAYEDATAFAADVARRVEAAGRPAGAVRAFPGSTFVIGDTDAEAREKYRQVRLAQITPQTALAYLEQYWGRDLSAYDPDGPLPEIDPAVEVSNETRGAGFQNARTREAAVAWREQAHENGWSIREFVIRHTARGNDDNGFVGSVQTIADSLQRYADSGIVAGFNITPYLTPTGLDDIVDKLVPELQSRGIYPSDYAGSTLREHLGLSPEFSPELVAA
ncbi:NtaA/DmoA family FMN-dependent monooxygenase [Pseudoclavibacter sp. 13-3]|uniref:NtaA/DmoA family FMN-dependent monooxygenase n=1 Tax=Pseudoclavibacter sp. 13-3 TaxID=2901228 RepID=UPI001E5E1E7A|nr:NtaA/DmoA family FMN-dependent monooxygenase [Pseudoclavibacter sp. 13-3]MCD7101435.1 NtaA/DmoA family FMN-dependent monooxygenase [Pseudoclavibacter sp. 13-3]